MDYTQSANHTVHASTGQRMHQNTTAPTTRVTKQDMNGVIWEIMEVIKAGVAAGAYPAALPFDEANPASYSQIKGAVVKLIANGVHTGAVPLLSALAVPPDNNVPHAYLDDSVTPHKLMVWHAPTLPATVGQYLSLTPTSVSAAQFPPSPAAYGQLWKNTGNSNFGNIAAGATGQWDGVDWVVYEDPNQYTKIYHPDESERFAGVGAPPFAFSPPSQPANIAIYKINDNDEVFRATKELGWQLYANPFTVSLPTSTTTRSINIGYTVEKAIVCPRDGVVQAFAKGAFNIATAPASWNNSAYNFQFVLNSTGGGADKQAAEFGLLGTVSGPSLGRANVLSSEFIVSAGDVIQLSSYVQVTAGTGNVAIESNLQLAYIK